MNIFLDDDRNLDDMTYMPFANIYFEIDDKTSRGQGGFGSTGLLSEVC